MRTSETLKALAPALAKAQGAMKSALKDAENPHFSSRYADLAAVWEACRDVLSSNGLAVVQAVAPMTADGHAVVTTRLLHSSGEWIEEDASTPVAKRDAQGLGSAVTYLRRYSLAAMVGVVADEDDDGNAASAPPRAKQAAKAAPEPAEPIARFAFEGTVTGGERHEKDGRQWWTIELTDPEGGEVVKATTFSSTDAKVASDAKASGATVVAILERKGRFINLKEIQA